MRQLLLLILFYCCFMSCDNKGPNYYKVREDFADTFISPHTVEYVMEIPNVSAEELYDRILGWAETRIYHPERYMPDYQIQYNYFCPEDGAFYTATGLNRYILINKAKSRGVFLQIDNSEHNYFTIVKKNRPYELKIVTRKGPTPLPWDKDSTVFWDVQGVRHASPEKRINFWSDSSNIRYFAHSGGRIQWYSVPKDEISEFEDEMARGGIHCFQENAVLVQGFSGSDTQYNWLTGATYEYSFSLKPGKVKLAISVTDMNYDMAETINENRDIPHSVFEKMSHSSETHQALDSLHRNLIVNIISLFNW